MLSPNLADSSCLLFHLGTIGCLRYLGPADHYHTLMLRSTSSGMSAYPASFCTILITSATNPEPSWPSSLYAQTMPNCCWDRLLPFSFSYCKHCTEVIKYEVFRLLVARECFEPPSLLRYLHELSSRSAIFLAISLSLPEPTPILLSQWVFCVVDVWATVDIRLELLWAHFDSQPWGSAL